MSKTTKSQCSFVIKRGPKKGQHCNKSCRGNLCKDHNKNRQKYVKNYNDERGEIVKKAAINERIEKLKTDEGKPVNITKERLKAASINDEISVLNKEIFGCMVKLDPEFPIPYQKKILDEIYSKDYEEDCRESYKCSHRKGLKFEEYLEEQRSQILENPDSFIRFTPFTGNISEATARINRLKMERLVLRNKLENQRYFISEYEKYREELNDKITSYKAIKNKKKVIEV
jgi:hypothetical protein